MKLPLCLLSLMVCNAFAGLMMGQEPELIGYFPSWKWTSRNNLVTPEKIAYDKLDIINYAFFFPLPDGTITGKDTVGDSLYLRGASDTRLTALAHKNGVKVLLSLGGWEDSNNFPAVAAHPDLRAVFAHSCVEAIRTYDLDGIDIDWEYPGYVGHKGTPADKENYTLLLQTLRDSLAAEGLLQRRRYLLTAALPASPSILSMIEIEKVANILDLLNVMTYDFYGPWDPVANHNAPLYPSVGADSARCIDAAFAMYNRVPGIPSTKINVGVPFYGQTYTHCTSLNHSHAGPDTTHFSRFGAFYYDIVRIIDRCERHWDEDAMVPYLVNKEWQLLISYDDEESVRAKASYVVDNNLHGLIIWEITGDYMPDGTTPLLNAIDSVFHTPTGTGP